MKPVADKVKALMTCPIPQTKRQIRGFLGQAGHYWHFIPSLASVMALLVALIKGNNPKKINWDGKCEKAFRELKK